MKGRGLCLEWQAASFPWWSFLGCFFRKNFHHCCWQFWWIQLLISVSLAWHGISHWTMQWAAGWVCGVITWITKEAWEVRQGYLTETCQLRMQSSIWAELASLFIQKGTVASVPRGIYKHCPVLFWFIFKSVTGTSFQLLLQVHSTFFKQSIWSSSHLDLISAHIYRSSGLLQCFTRERKGTS